jgi:hypothetical protein
VSNTIRITACDNEVFLIAYQSGGSYVLAHLNSGYNFPVDVTVTILSGDYSQVPTLNGQSGALKESYTVYLPEGTYTVVAVCVNWGGPWAYAYQLNNGPLYSGSDAAGAGAIATGPGLTVSATSSKTTIIFSGLVPGGSTTSYTESGFNLSGTNIYASAYGLTPPGKAAFPSGTGTTFTLTRTDGASFAVTSVDVRNLNAQVPAQTVTFTGNLAAGGTVSHTITTDALSAAYKTYAFPSSFSKLRSLVWNPNITCTTNIKLS